MTNKEDSFLLSQNPFFSWSFLTLRQTENAELRPAGRSRHYFTFWARNAIYHSLQAAAVRPGEEVLVPGYICRVVPEAVTAYGATAVFYHVRRDCSADFVDLEAKITPRTRAVIAVHYFGFPQPIELFREICVRRNLFLIEDCAHVLRSKINGQLLGTFGDASVFSLRKFFPLHDGAELVLNSSDAQLVVPWSRATPLLSLAIIKDIIDQVAEHSSSLPVRLIRRFLEWAKPFLRRVRSSAPGALLPEKTSSTFEKHLVNQPMSSISRILFDHADITAIRTVRRTNYLFLQTELTGVRGLHFLIEVLDENVCPWVFPVFFEGQADACSVIRNMGVPATTWDGVRPAGLEWSVFAHEDFLYQNLIFLPIHQNLTTNDLHSIAKTVKHVGQRQVPPTRKAKH